MRRSSANHTLSAMIIVTAMINVFILGSRIFYPLRHLTPSPIQPIVTTIRRGFDAMRSSGVANLCIGVSAYRPLSAFKTQEINGVLKTSGRCTTTTTNRNSTLTAGLDLLQAGPRFRKKCGGAYNI